MTVCRYEELSHTSEVGMRIHSSELPLLWACACEGMFGIMGARARDRQSSREVLIESVDRESLMVDWLSELLYLFESTGLVYDRAEISAWQTDRLTAIVSGGRPARTPRRSIKAVTYHGLQFRETGNGWMVDVYFDV